MGFSQCIMYSLRRRRKSHGNKKYTKVFKIWVAEDALKPENDRAVEILAVKYGIQPRTVAKWKNLYKEHGPQAFHRGCLPAKDKQTEKLLKENAEF